MAGEAYQIALADLFEGPMDLLVHLIKKNELDIYDIPIAFITEQFLAYLEWMKSLDIDIAGDFLVMAATLTHIKSRMLLPSRTTDDADEQDSDPRDEIAAPLLEYLQMKSVAEQLASRPMLEVDVFTRREEHRAVVAVTGEKSIEADLMDLLRAYQALVKRVGEDQSFAVTFERISVKEKMSEVIDRIREVGSLRFGALLPQHPGRMEIIVTFLAILEIVKLNLVRLEQEGPGEDLLLSCREAPEAAETR
jgi:segregation and condensation protein A